MGSDGDGDLQSIAFIQQSWRILVFSLEERRKVEFSNKHGMP